MHLHLALPRMQLLFQWRSKDWRDEFPEIKSSKTDLYYPFVVNPGYKLIPPSTNKEVPFT
jgi:hypothetical protein